MNEFENSPQIAQEEQIWKKGEKMGVVKGERGRKKRKKKEREKKKK